MRVIEQESFFLLLNGEEINSLVPNRYLDDIKTIFRHIERLNQDEIYALLFLAKHFKSLHKFLKKEDVHKIHRETRDINICIHQERAVVQKEEFKTILDGVDTKFKMYSEYIHSAVVADKIDSGVCFDIQMRHAYKYYKQMRNEAALETTHEHRPNEVWW